MMIPFGNIYVIVKNGEIYAEGTEEKMHEKWQKELAENGEQGVVTYVVSKEEYYNNLLNRKPE